MSADRTPAPAGRPDLRPPMWDAVLALTLLVVLGLPSAAFGASFGRAAGASGTVAVLAAAVVTGCAVLMPVVTAWRRTLPAASAATVYAAALVHLLAGARWLPVDVVVLVALYAVTVHGPRWARRAALGGALVGAVAMGVVFGSGFWGGTWTLTGAVAGFLSTAGLVAATWALAVARRARLERLAALEERARRLEVERDQQMRLAVTGERTRIAREMHDVVAHSLSVVVAQADGGRYAARTDPAAAEQALATIATTGREALADMRRILGVLRGEPGAAPDHRPQPGSTDLDELLTQVRRTGLAVSHVRTGTARPLPAGAGMSVYRIVQESLTNVLKHAGPQARVTVLLAWQADRLVVQVDDDGRGSAAAADGLGQGLVGMRERAALVGGTLTAGPRPGGGFRVRAEIPVPPVAAPHPPAVTFPGPRPAATFRAWPQDPAAPALPPPPRRPGER